MWAMGPHMAMRIIRPNPSSPGQTRAPGATGVQPRGTRRDEIKTYKSFPLKLWPTLKKDRYFFLGRKNDIVNIGGNTISLQVVKNELNKIKEIKIFKLKSLANPILGNIIELEYVGNISQNNIESKLIKKLPKYALPISFKKLKNIELNSNNKS